MQRDDREDSGTDGGDSNMTYNQAVELCNQTLMRDCALSSIKNETSANDIPSVLECAKDLMLNPTVPWPEAVCQHVSSVIAGTVSRDKDFQDNNPVKATFISEQDQCKGNCSNNGLCIGEEKCSCFEGFGCNDCSLDLSLQVEILSTQGDGVCNDHLDEDCSRIRVTTRGHLSTAKCKTVIKRASIGHGFEEEMDVTNENCGCPHMYDIYCCWDMASVYMKQTTVDTTMVYQLGFSISNDGMTFGNVEYVSILDTLCQEVKEQNGKAIANLKSGYCFIDGVCYSEGDLRTSNPCEVCHPPNSLLSWTTRNCSITAAGKDTTTTTIALVSTCVGLAIVSLVVTILVIVVKKRRPHPTDATGTDRLCADIDIKNETAFRRELTEIEMNTVTDGRLATCTDSYVNQNTNLTFEMTDVRKIDDTRDGIQSSPRADSEVK